jgi:DNA-binding transcriptional MerR regulator
MDDEEDQETPFQEMDAHQLAAQVAWVRLFIRELRKRGYALEDIITLLDEPGMTVEAAVERILSSKGPKAN